MYDNEKISRFLRAIDRHAKKRQSEMLEKIKSMEEQELRKAEMDIINDVRVMVQRELDNMKNKISIEVSHKELEERRKIAKKRKEMISNVFRESENRLGEFTKTKEYRESLIRYASNISKVLKEDDVILYVYKEDIKYEDMIKKGFGRACQVKVANDIKVGGIRGFSKKEGLIADETIDAKLSMQEEWFLEKYGNTLVQDFLGKTP